MRIISGKYRRRKLHANPGETTRPITDRAKEIFFQYVEQSLLGKKVCDIFCGTGSLGLEALSRGAETAVFIEADREAYALLQKNVEHIGVAEACFCWRTDVFRTSFRPKNLDGFLPYGILFFDPPYRMAEQLDTHKPLWKSLRRLAKEEISTPDARLFFRTSEFCTPKLPRPWVIQDQINISSMKIHVCGKERGTTPNEAEDDTQSACDPDRAVG